MLVRMLVHTAGRYTEAAEKYARARDNVADMTNSEAVQLRRACVLNLSSCYLNSKKYEQCVQCCKEVLAGGPTVLMLAIACVCMPYCLSHN